MTRFTCANLRVFFATPMTAVRRCGGRWWSGRRWRCLSRWFCVASIDKLFGSIRYCQGFGAPSVERPCYSGTGQGSMRRSRGTLLPPGRARAGLGSCGRASQRRPARSLLLPRSVLHCCTQQPVNSLHVLPSFIVLFIQSSAILCFPFAARSEPIPSLRRPPSAKSGRPPDPPSSLCLPCAHSWNPPPPVATGLSLPFLHPSLVSTTHCSLISTEEPLCFFPALDIPPFSLHGHLRHPLPALYP